MSNSILKKTDMKERAIFHQICSHNGILAKEIAKNTGLDRSTVNHYLYSSPFMNELCRQDDSYCWHGLIRQDKPHTGLGDFCAYSSYVDEFTALDDDAWFNIMLDGCRRVGRSTVNTRGLFHSFMDCRHVMLELFSDLGTLVRPDWEIAFELKINKGRYVRIFADVIVITADKVFSLEFKMKDRIEIEEVCQAAKYAGYLEVLFGPDYDVISALVLTASSDLYRYEPLPGTDAAVPVCSGDMLLNLFDEYMDFLIK